MTKISIYEVERDYIEYLRSFDEVVRQEKDHPNAKARKYIGILLEINECNYFAPLASPKKKFKFMKNDKDFMKIYGGKFGAINFNNMIPISADALISYDIKGESDKKYQNVLIEQAKFVRKNKNKITKVAKELFEIITGDKDEDVGERIRLKDRCCEFKLLEGASKNYVKDVVK